MNCQEPGCSVELNERDAALGRRYCYEHRKHRRATHRDSFGNVIQLPVSGAASPAVAAISSEAILSDDLALARLAVVPGVRSGAFSSIICGVCGSPLYVCARCRAAERWYLHCQQPRCYRAEKQQHEPPVLTASVYLRSLRPPQAPITLPTPPDTSGWKRPLRSVQKLRGSPDGRVDEIGRVRVKIFLVTTTDRPTGKPGHFKPGEKRPERASGQLKLGNIQRCLTVESGRVSEIFEAIERALFGGPEADTAD